MNNEPVYKLWEQSQSRALFFESQWLDMGKIAIDNGPYGSVHYQLFSTIKL